MSVMLAWLSSHLASLVPAQNSVPSAAQYQQCCEDAVIDYATRKSNQKVTTLSVVSGTATYALPSDFMRMIEFEPLTSTDGLLISSAGLIPLDADFDEIYTWAGGNLTIFPTPTYTADRDLLYAAGHVLDSTGAYPDLTAADARIVLLKAQALAFELQSSVSTQGGWKYQIGDEMVDKSGMSGIQRGQADYFRAQYEAALERAIGPFGVRGWISETR